MTWYFEITGESTMTVWDHEGTKIAEDTPVRIENGEPAPNFSGDFPARVKEIARESMEGNQPSAYNQTLLADMATDNIERGTPS